MSCVKQNFVDGQTLTAAQLNHMEDGIAAAATGVKGDPGEGFTASARALLLTLFENAAYKTDTMQPTLNALRAEWGGSAQDVPVQSVSLSSTTMTLSEGESKTLTDGFAAAYDETTMTGALEKMLDYLAKNYSDKRVAYVFPHGGMFSSTGFGWHKTYKPAILAALEKWSVPYIDIAESTPPMGGSGISALGDKYTTDGTHPNAAGYERFYTEPIAALLKRL